MDSYNEVFCSKSPSRQSKRQVPKNSIFKEITLIDGNEQLTFDIKKNNENDNLKIYSWRSSGNSSKRSPNNDLSGNNIEE